MITKLIGRTRSVYNGAVINEIAMAFDNSLEYRFKRIDGTGPVDSEITRSITAIDAGSQYLSAKTGERNIVVTVEFSPNYGINSTVTHLRKWLSQVYMPGNLVELEFHNEIEESPFFIKGHVEALTPDVWTKDPTVQISIICEEPFFWINKPAEYFRPTEFPVFCLDFPGLVTQGFRYSFNVVDSTPYGIFLSDLTGDGDLAITGQVNNGDKYEISTVPGDRYVRRIRNAATENVLGVFQGSLTEAKLKHGPNWFRHNDYGRTDNVRFEWNRLYGEI